MKQGLQENNYSPKGFGQPQQGKDGKKKKVNFMDDIGYRPEEPLAPGIPAAQMGATLNNTLPIIPQGNQGYGYGIKSASPITPEVRNSNTPPSPNPQYNPQIYTGFTPLQRMEGFDFNREQNTGRSAKDAFAWLANEAARQGHAAPLDATGDAAKRQYQDWFNTYIAPGFNQLGHTIDWVDGDKVGWHNWQGRFNTDFGRGAGAPGGALAWQTEDANAPLPTRAPANLMYEQFQNQLVNQDQNDNSLEELLMALLSRNQESL